MRAERREAREYRLLVADIGVNVVEHRDARSARDGHRNTGLCERGKEPDCFQKYGLASGVGSGDEKCSLVLSHLERERHDVDPLREEQRVPSLDDVKTLTRVGEVDRRAAELDRVPRARRASRA